MRLNKSLYGLKQAGRLWAELLHKTLVELGFVQSYTDSCLYFNRNHSGTTIVGVYVDDLLVTGTNTTFFDQFFQDMHVLEVKDLGIVTKFLGMGVTYDDKNGYALEQKQCIRERLATTGLDLANPTRTPTGEDQDGEGEGDLLPGGSGGTAKQPTIATFQSLIGSLLWIARCTRPDIAFAVHRASRRSHAPRECDWR